MAESRAEEAERQLRII
jgi:hypothetical protein